MDEVTVLRELKVSADIVDIVRREHFENNEENSEKLRKAMELINDVRKNKKEEMGKKVIR